MTNQMHRMFYDMTKNGRDLGINVLSGLVKVERGEPASRSGLAGPNPLSVSDKKVSESLRQTENQISNQQTNLSIMLTLRCAYLVFRFMNEVTESMFPIMRNPNTRQT